MNYLEIPQFVVKTQLLENYGAHDGSGKFSDNQARWKFKGGTDYLVHDLDRAQDAMAFVAAQYIINDISIKVFPTEVITYDEWLKELETLSKDYADFIIGEAVHISPNWDTERRAA